MTEEHQRLHLQIAGRVQGVFYRVSTRDQARSLGLTGWVRNLSNGDVEALAEGSRQALEALALWCEQGPAWARVDEVHATWSKATGEFPDFGVR